MADHGLQLISNPLWDETQPSRRMGNTGDLTKDNQWAHVPGTDLITADYTAGSAEQPGPQRRLGRPPERPGACGSGVVR